MFERTVLYSVDKGCQMSETTSEKEQAIVDDGTLNDERARRLATRVA